VSNRLRNLFQAVIVSSRRASRNRMVATVDHTRLPENLPEPLDDGACDHLVGLSLPAVELLATDGTYRSLRDVGSRWLVIYAYPQTGGPQVSLPDDWDQIPGARGCTPQSCGFRDLHSEFTSIDATIWGMSSQPIDQQREFVERMQIPFLLLNDEALRLTDEPLRLPTFLVGERPLYRRVTLVAEYGRIVRAFYPIFPSDQNASRVMKYLQSAAAPAWSCSER
jgi:peroxiredoxin